MPTPPSLRVWDLPLRLFHVLLAICVVGAFVTIKVGGLWLDYHMLFGYAVLTLLLFRLVWGVIGGDTARFARFVKGPCTIAAYLRGRWRRVPGHNPLGALSVLAMLAVLGFQAVSGLFANDDIFSEGPLASHVDKSLSDTLTSLHKLNEWPILALVALHLLSLLWYRVVKKQRLVAPMITGDADRRTFDTDAQPVRDGIGTRLLALAIALAAAGTVYAIVALRPAGF